MRHILNMHAHLLRDQRRLTAFERALQTVVTTDSIVLDLGCGTGILGLLACRAGASRVYAVDASGVIEAARAIAVSSGFAGRIVHVHGDGSDMSVPEPVDVIVGDQMGPLGFEAGLIPMYKAAARFLKPGGNVLPSAIETWLAPVDAPAEREVSDRWAQPVHGIDMSALRHYEANGIRDVAPEAVTLLDDGRRVAVLQPGVDGAATQHLVTVQFRVQRAGSLNGLCGWFVASLAAGVAITNGVHDSGRIDRRPALLPIVPAIEMNCGDHIDCTIGIRPATNLVEWRGTIRRDAVTIATFAHSTLPAIAIASRATRKAT